MNTFTSREDWMRTAANALRPQFEEIGYPLPDEIRFAIAFPSVGGRGNRLGEFWRGQSTADGIPQIIVRCDIEDPGEILAVMLHELVHLAAPNGAAHGPQFREVALAMGLTGKMKEAMPGEEMQQYLDELARWLGPIPHAAVDFRRGDADGVGIPVDSEGRRPRKTPTGNCYIMVWCDKCGYSMRTTRKWITMGVPQCPLGHGTFSHNG